MSQSRRWALWGFVNLCVFAGALVLPIVELRQFYLFQSEVVLIDVPLLLVRNGEYVLALVITLLGIAYPIAKSTVYGFAGRWPRLVRIVGAFSAISFFDIFLVALLIFVVKGSVGAEATTALGIYPLVAFAVSSKWLDWSYTRALRRAAPA